MGLSQSAATPPYPPRCAGRGKAVNPLRPVPAAAGSAEPAPLKPVLPPNEATLAKLRALRPNQAVTLGQAQVMGDFNDVARRFNLHKTGPRGRDFTIKMVWAPERRRVLFCGANHGVPHRLNDVWEFDLAALTWAMLYAPDLPRDPATISRCP